MTTGATILANLTSWWEFDGDTLDAHGTNDIAANLTVAGYEAGLTGQQLSQGSRGTVALAASIPITTSTGQISWAGWVSYDGASGGAYIGGLARHLGASTQEVLTLINQSGHFTLFGWKDNGANTYQADSGLRTLPYPVTVQVHDSIGQSATSDQIIRIAGTDLQAGTYFITCTYNNGSMKLYVNAELLATTVVDAIYNSPIYYWQIGAVSYGTTDCGWEDALLMDAHVLSQTEIDWLYNAGAGRSYADVVAE